MFKLFISALALAATLPAPAANSELPHETATDVPYGIVDETSLLSGEQAYSSIKTNLSIEKRTVTVTAYSSAPEETDDTPFITASGNHVREGSAASNFLPLGTAIKIPALFGDRVFIIEDRMSVKNNGKVDIWFPTKAEAKRFGMKKATIEILH